MKVHVVLFGFEDLAEQVAGDEIADGLTMGDPLAQRRQGILLEPQIAFEHLLHAFPDHQFVEILQIGQAVEEQNALDQLVGMLHLVDRLAVFVGAELGDAPMPQRAGMQEILIDRGKLVFQHRIQMLQDGRIATHGRPPRN